MPATDRHIIGFVFVVLLLTTAGVICSVNS
jgi:hypothetical protein